MDEQLIDSNTSGVKRLILLSFFEDSGFRKIKLQFLFTYVQRVIAAFFNFHVNYT